MLLVPVRGNKLTHSMIYLRAQFMPFIPSSLLESLFFGQRCPSSLFSDRLLGAILAGARCGCLCGLPGREWSSSRTPFYCVGAGFARCIPFRVSFYLYPDEYQRCL